MIRGLPHIFARVFNTPLAISPARLDPLVSGLRASASFRRSLLIGDDEDDDERDRIRPRFQRYGLTQDGIAVLPIRGVLVRRAGEIASDSTELESYARIDGMLRQALGDARVRGILLDIDSPGGEVGGLFELVANIRAAALLRPVWAIANDDAMSAGYALASAADRLYLTGTGGVGGIGVVALHCDQSGFDAAEGLNFEYVYAGERKVDANPHEPLSDPARAAVQGEIDRLYTMFVDMVAAHRGMSAASVRGTEAAVAYGPDALANGLADRQGTLADAATALGDLINGRTTMSDPVPNEPPAEVPALPPLPAPVAPPSAPAGTNAGTVGDALEAAVQARAGHVVQLDLVRQTAAATRVEASEIIAMCNLAGWPALAQDFVSRGMTVTAARTDLQRRQAEAQEATQIETVNTAPPVTAEASTGQPSELSKALADRWARQMGRQ